MLNLLPRATVLAVVMLLVPWHVARADEGKHLFILSGQSNMHGLDPDLSFTPTVTEAFEKDHVIVIKDAESGQPIRRWYKDWKDAKGEPAPEERPPGDLYDRLMSKVNEAIEGEKLATVTFVWMQGERDARESLGDVYAKSLKGLIEQLRTDMQRPDIDVVIGRISDFDMSNERYPHWTLVRKAQVAVAEDETRATWVDTDDLNGEDDDLHYTKPDGYRELGERFADAAIKLIQAEP